MSENDISSSVAIAEIDTQITENDNSANAQVDVEIGKKVSIRVKGGKIYAFFKRAFDISVSLIGLLVIWPFFLIIGIIIKCTSKGPIFYVSDRVGKNGKLFKFYKFRTMCADAEEQLSSLLDKNEIEGGVIFKMTNDPRITKFGKFLRRTSIDELPQLLNVLKGDMSFVGPRPCTPREYELYSEFDKLRLVVPQGLTGEWQVSGRSDVSFKTMIELDIHYIENKRSFWHDIKIIFKTIFVVCRNKGAR